MKPIAGLIRSAKQSRTQKFSCFAVMAHLARQTSQASWCIEVPWSVLAIGTIYKKHKSASSHCLVNRMGLCFQKSPYFPETRFAEMKKVFSTSSDERTK